MSAKSSLKAPSTKFKSGSPKKLRKVHSDSRAFVSMSPRRPSGSPAPNTVNEPHGEDVDYVLRSELLNERQQKEEALLELDQLRKSYSEILLQYAEAKNTIDRLRFQGCITPDTSWQQLQNSPYGLNAISIPDRLSGSLPVFQRHGESSSVDEHEPDLCTRSLPCSNEELPSDYVESLACSCPPEPKKSGQKSQRCSSASNGSPKASRRRTISPDSTQRKAQSLCAQLSMADLHNGTLDEAVKAAHVSHLRLQLKDLREDVDSLESLGEDTKSLQETVTSIDDVIRQYETEDEDDDEWKSMDSRTNSSHTSLGPWITEDNELCKICGNRLREFNAEFHEDLLDIKRMVDGRSVSTKDARAKKATGNYSDNKPKQQLHFPWFKRFTIHQAGSKIVCQSSVPTQQPAKSFSAASRSPEA